MESLQQQDHVSEFESPGGFTFGVQGWNWGEQRPRSITFFLDGTAKVFDQHGRPIKGTVSKDGKPIYFNRCSHAQVIAALNEEMRMDVLRDVNDTGAPCPQCKGARRTENGQWCRTCYHKASGESTGLKPTITVSGWPQLPYEQLKALKGGFLTFLRATMTADTKPTYLNELRKIKDPQLRKDALRLWREMEKAQVDEMAATADE